MLEPVLIVPDTHRPFHNKRAWGLMLKVAEPLKPKHIVIIGDFADFYDRLLNQNSCCVHLMSPKNIGYHTVGRHMQCIWENTR